MASGVGLDSAFGADAVNQIRAAVMQRLLQQQQLTQGAQGMDLAQRASDRADRALTQQDELRKATLAQNADLKDQGALDTMINQGAFTKGQVLSSPTVQRFQKHGVGDLLEPQQSLPSTQMQGGAAMPQLRGRMIPQSGAVGPEQGEASSGAMTSTQTTPMLTGRLMFRGTQKEADTTAERERKIQHDQEQATNQSELAGIRERLASVAESKQPQAHFSALPQFDENGKPLAPMAFDANTGTARPIPGVGTNKTAPGAAQNQQHEQSKKEALGSLAQLDQAIDAAKDLIGPGEGRISSIQQMVGNADPRIQALGTKMLLAKMQVDHAATGTVRAGASPQLLSRWDNILANKVTPEGLKAAVQAMREILGGQATVPAGPAQKPTAADLIKKYGG